jgi:outer membrane lipoprotein LolB
LRVLARGARGGLLILLTLLLAACAARPARVHEPTAQSWPERLRALEAIEHFELNGRLAASNGADAFSAGVHWRQQRDDAVIDLSGPLGLGAAHIVQNGASLSVTNAQGVVYRGPPAGEQMASTLGFDPPLASLRYWVLGVSDPSPVASQVLDAQQRLTHLQQQGWQIDYEQYSQVQDLWLPRRLSITQGRYRLKLVVNAWQLGGHDGPL